jgi:hypothetical protein
VKLQAVVWFVPWLSLKEMEAELSAPLAGRGAIGHVTVAPAESPVTVGETVWPFTCNTMVFVLTDVSRF